MASIKEIRTHIKSVEQTLKITNAMYLISSSSLRKARRQLTDVEPYFSKIEAPSPISSTTPRRSTTAFSISAPVSRPTNGRRASSSSPATKGWRGPTTTTFSSWLRRKCPGPPIPASLWWGRWAAPTAWSTDIPIDVEFLYTAQTPTCAGPGYGRRVMLDLYLDGQLDEVYVLFTKMVSSFQMEPTAHKLLPWTRMCFLNMRRTGTAITGRGVCALGEGGHGPLVPGYVKGDLFGALVESYCSEQNARMTAMKSSSDNARAMLQRLTCPSTGPARRPSPRKSRRL